MFKENWKKIATLRILSGFLKNFRILNFVVDARNNEKLHWIFQSMRTKLSKNLRFRILFRFFDNFAHIGWNFQWIFRYFWHRWQNLKYTFYENFFKNPLKILRVAIFFPVFFKQILLAKNSFDFHGLDVKKFSSFFAFRWSHPFLKMWIFHSIFWKIGKT